VLYDNNVINVLRLLETRKKRGFSQADLANLPKTMPLVNYKNEREKVTLSIKVTLKFAIILGVPVVHPVGHKDQEIDTKTLKRSEKLSKINFDDHNFILHTIDYFMCNHKIQITNA